MPREGATAGGEPTVAAAAEILSACAREITAATSVEDTLGAIVTSAATSLPRIDHAGITTAHADGRLLTRASSESSPVSSRRTSSKRARSPRTKRV